MESSIIVSIISAIATIVTVVINTKSSNREIQHKLETSQAVTETKLENLTSEFREYIAYSKRMPVVEEQLKIINHRIDLLERDINELDKPERPHS